MSELTPSEPLSRELNILLLNNQMRPYQREGVVWATSRFRETDVRALALCDEPGLGKTLQALALALSLGVLRLIVVCPAGARQVWQQEISRWLPAWAPHVYLVEPGALAREHADALDRPQVIVLIAYDTLAALSRNRRNAWATALTQRSWDMLIVDEAQYLKNASHRTLAVYGPRGSDDGIQSACERVLLLTGTLTPNHCGELYQHLRALWPQTLVVPRPAPVAYARRPPAPPARQTLPTIGSSLPEPTRMLTQAEFEERVTDCRDTLWGRQIVRSKNQQWLRERLGPVILRRTKAQVLPELPALITQDIPLAAPDHSDIDQALWRSGVLFWDRTKHLGDTQFVAELHRHAMENGVSGSITTLRRELGLLKAAPAAEWIAERLSCGTQKMLVFGWHIDVLARLHALLAPFDPVLVNGSTAPAARADAVRRFQEQPRVRVFVGQMLAAGTAITLTAASEVAIVEPSWVPGENKQAIDRAHRLGQRDSVLASFLFIPGTLDARIMGVFRRKALEIAELEGSNTHGRSSRVDQQPIKPRGPPSKPASAGLIGLPI
jgi:SWI/SNF-related matrix-associated actin-dependent regulator 1 of chromatin subfamily A